MALRYDEPYKAVRPCGCKPAPYFVDADRCETGALLAARSINIARDKRWPNFPGLTDAVRAYNDHVFGHVIGCNFCPAWSFDEADLAVMGESEREDAGSDTVRSCRPCWEKAGRAVGWLVEEIVND